MNHLVRRLLLLRWHVQMVVDYSIQGVEHTRCQAHTGCWKSHCHIGSRNHHVSSTSQVLGCGMDYYLTGLSGLQGWVGVGEDCLYMPVQ